ncbi:MAG: site-specific integrase [Planctomycetes bacterium]|nr:site-specific integrase [Planctomycetota bacterium]
MRKALKPWYRTQTDTWYATVRGEKIPLAKGRDSYAEAEKAFHRLMLDVGEGQPPDPSAKPFHVVAIIDLFLDHPERHNSRETYAWYKRFLQSFCELHGRTLAAELKPIHVTRWLDANTWKGGQRNTVIAVKRAFNWADKQGVLSPNPLRNVEKPPAGRRTRIVTAEERAEILAAVKDRNFKEFLTALYQTGCRPSEVARVTAANVNLELGVWIFEQHKTGKKTGKPRVIYLSPEMVEMSRRLMAERPEGRLFPSRKLGRPFTQNAIRIRFRRLREKLPHLKGVVCYSLRHSYATDALERGVGIAQVAELLGHVGTRMVSRHYGRLHQKVAHMREAARKATGQ